MTGLLLCVGLFAVLVVAVVVVVIVVLVLQQPRPPQSEEERPWAPAGERERREEPPARRTAGFDVRFAEDGFWLVAPAVASGSVVHYRCRVDGRLEHGSITFEPGAQGQFVYTGGRPSDVEVLQVDPPPVQPPLPPERWEEPLAPIPPPPPPPRASTPPPARKPPSGFPTAY